jgi:hypothetical protein
MRHPFYLGFGILLILAVAAAELRGWGMSSRNEVRSVPATVRDNPASYRPTYIHSGSTFRRGK